MDKRPTALTVICIIFFVTAGFGVLMIPFVLPKLNAVYGSWYGPYFLISFVLTVISMIGIWRMKKWGLYLYLVLFLVGIIIGIVAKVHFTLPTLLGVIVPIVIIAVGLANLKKMT